MSTEMSFKELFDHLAMYIYDPEQRWKQVVRAKRCLTDCSEVGGCGYDQCYFEGRSPVSNGKVGVACFSKTQAIMELKQCRRRRQRGLHKSNRFRSAKNNSNNKIINMRTCLCISVNLVPSVGGKRKRGTKRGCITLCLISSRFLEDLNSTQ